MLEDSTPSFSDSTSKPRLEPPATARELGIGLCPPDDRAEALAVLYHRLSASTRANMIVELLRQEARGQLDLSGLWIASRKRRIVGAMLTQTLAGRAIAIWPPVIARSWGAASLASSMVREALRVSEAQGIRLAQALVEDNAPKQTALDLARGGLAYVTDLLYLGRPTHDVLPIPPGVPPLEWRGYTPDRHDRFARMLERSYQGSLDMPELAGLRSLDDVLQGHLARGSFDPDRWRLGWLEGQTEPVAVLLLLAGSESTWEVSYLGLAPEARGRGLGRRVLAHALELTRPHAHRLELAVDVRNLPADRLYQRCGFHAFVRRRVHLAVLGRRGPEGAGSPPLQDGSVIG
ncbi:GNAT family N-acetyltransferase [Tautonia rosea]|uniref:GNAT family N-acetyltransferase n=1 Tax=Tautonia rosea TaxID=2728037 RepID=UPI00147340F0|nr:GNAT family N-acetyltransferase [Tautonia rosea]